MIKKCNQNNMKESNSHISSKNHMVYIKKVKIIPLQAYGAQRVLGG
jgi:hypothetical protein